LEESITLLEFDEALFSADVSLADRNIAHPVSVIAPNYKFVFYCVEIRNQSLRFWNPANKDMRADIYTLAHRLNLNE
jgi:hypothetical protein